MTLANVVRLNFFTTDVDELFKQFGRVNERFGDSRYATTVLGVAQLPAQFLVMLEATAADYGSVVYETPANVRASASSGGGI